MYIVLTRSSRGCKVGKSANSVSIPILLLAFIVMMSSDNSSGVEIIRHAAVESVLFVRELHARAFEPVKTRRSSMISLARQTGGKIGQAEISKKIELESPSIKA